MNKGNKVIPSIKDVNVLYLISMALFVGIGVLIQLLLIQPPSLPYSKHMLFIVLMQFLFVLLPVIIYIIVFKIDIKTTFRINKISFKNVIISIFVMLFAMPIASILNAIVIVILSYFGKTHPPIIFPSENMLQLTINILVIALVPAIFEELFFRGLVLKGYEKLGIGKAIIFSSFLFGLLHRDIQSLVGTFILGLVIAYIVYRTNSIFAGMIAHFTNNAVIVLFTFFTTKIQPQPDNYNINIFEQFAGIDAATIVMMIIIIIFILLTFVGMFTGTIFLLKYTTRNIQRDTSKTQASKKSNFAYIPLLASFVLVLYVFLNQLI